jgi:hypothetical protein
MLVKVKADYFSNCDERVKKEKNNSLDCPAMNFYASSGFVMILIAS